MLYALPEVIVERATKLLVRGVLAWIRTELA